MIVPSPSSNGVVKLSDETTETSYIELPASTRFVESCAVNLEFSESVYLPLQLSDELLYVYEVRLGWDAAKPFHGPVALPGEAPSKLTPYGSVLTADGHLWVCVYNRNAVVDLDLTDGRISRVLAVPAPNDVAIGRRDVYVAGGTASCGVTDPTRGAVYAASTGDVVVRAELAIAGIAAHGEEDTLYVAQLVDMFTVPGGVVWRGDDGDRVWLADNARWFDETRLVVPAYRAAPRAAATCLRTRVCASIANAALQCATCKIAGESCEAACRDPEVALVFSRNDTADPFRFFVFDVRTRAATHFALDLESAHRRPSTTARAYYFDSNVTHVSRVRDHLVCVNFQQPRLLVIPVEAITPHLGGTTTTIQVQPRASLCNDP